MCTNIESISIGGITSISIEGISCGLCLTSVCVGSSLTCSFTSKSDFLFFLGLADLALSVLLPSTSAVAAAAADESSSPSLASSLPVGSFPSSSSACGASVFLACAAAAVAAASCNLTH